MIYNEEGLGLYLGQDKPIFLIEAQRNVHREYL